MNPLGDGVSYLDLQFQSRSRVIAAAVVHGANGVALIDPGPSSALPVLRAELAAAGISVGDLTALVLTHIHLDHAGASGTLVRENPKLRVYVHERGAPHLVDPSKLVASATRLWGDAMDRLWGEVAPVPAHALDVLAGGERIEAGGRTFDVAYTPGHASHHVSYFNRDCGIAFVGDAAGVKLWPDGCVLPPTPPPDIDLEIWQRSLDAIAGWSPETLFVTHFGPHENPGPHIESLRDHLTLAADIARRSLQREDSDDEQAAWFAGELRRALGRCREWADGLVDLAAPLELSWRGLARYWRKKADRS